MSNKEQHIEKEEQLQEEKHEEQQKTEETEVEAVNGVDPLEEAILRVQELEAQLTEMVKKNRISYCVVVLKWIISAVVLSKMWRKPISLD